MMSLIGFTLVASCGLIFVLLAITPMIADDVIGVDARRDEGTPLNPHSNRNEVVIERAEAA